MRILLFFLCMLPALSGSAAARIFRVNPDGTGDFSTIQAAIDATASADEVVLGDGTFVGPGNRDLTWNGRAITVRSDAGDPVRCIIDCEAAVAFSRRGFALTEAGVGGTVIQGISITRGSASDALDGGRGGAILADLSDGGLLSVRNCRFFENSAVSGGALACGSPVTVEDCVFQENRALAQGGALFATAAGPQVMNCRFLLNLANEWGGAVCTINAPLEIASCTFARNRSPVAGALLSDGSTALVDRCTFWGNDSEAEGAGVITMRNGVLTIGRTIVTRSFRGQAVLCDPGATVTVACSDIYRNAGGSWIGCLESQLGIGGNLNADPMLCDPTTGVYLLASGSPCTAANNSGCGQIGAWDVGCEQTEVHVTTWGSVKARYSR